VAHSQGKVVLATELDHILSTKSCVISSTSQICNILAYLGSMSDGVRTTSFVQMAVTLLDKEIKRQDIPDAHKKKLMFLSEQLSLVSVPSKRRRYSPDMLAAAMIWKTTSTSLYKQLLFEDLLTLPPIRRLRQLSEPLSTETGISESAITYLKAHFDNIQEREKFVVLIADEIYCAQRVEYSGGKLYGNEEGSSCKTLLCFMIKAIAGHYSDTVSLIPVSKLDTAKIQEEYNQVMKAMTNLGFQVVSMSLDNATPNRKFYVHEFCKGILKPQIPHPLLPNKPLFLTFDAVHNFKNIYNSFINRREPWFPSFPSQVCQLYHKNSRFS